MNRHRRRPKADVAIQSRRSGLHLWIVSLALAMTTLVRANGIRFYCNKSELVANAR